MTITNERGNVMVYIAITIMTVAALIVGAFYVDTSSNLSQLGAKNENKAYMLALSGKYYALTNNLPDNSVATSGQGTDYTVDANIGDVFNLLITGTCSVPFQTVTIMSTGVVNFKTPFETRRTLLITRTCYL